jgi:hypothetical protein
MAMAFARIVAAIVLAQLLALVRSHQPFFNEANLHADRVIASTCCAIATLDLCTKC